MIFVLERSIQGIAYSLDRMADCRDDKDEQCADRFDVDVGSVVARTVNKRIPALGGILRKENKAGDR